MQKTQHITSQHQHTVAHTNTGEVGEKCREFKSNMSKTRSDVAAALGTHHPLPSWLRASNGFYPLLFILFIAYFVMLFPLQRFLISHKVRQAVTFAIAYNFYCSS